MSDNPTEFDLPERITAVLPADPYEQLDIARKITSIALATRVSKLEVEAARLRQKLVEKDDAIAELQETLQKLEDSLCEAEEKLSIATHEKVDWSGLLMIGRNKHNCLIIIFVSLSSAYFPSLSEPAEFGPAFPFAFLFALITGKPSERERLSLQHSQEAQPRCRQGRFPLF